MLPIFPSQIPNTADIQVFLNQCQEGSQRADSVQLITQRLVSQVTDIYSFIPELSKAKGMATIRMTEQQMKLYVDNVFQKYDKDRSYTLDLQELSEFLNDLLLSRGSIALPSLEQVKNSMRALNPSGGDGMTKQTLFSTLERLNGAVDDVVVAILETMNHQQPIVQNNTPKPQFKAGFTPRNRSISPRPEPRTLPPVSSASNINQLNHNQATSSYHILPQQQQQSANLYTVPKQYTSNQNILAVRSTPTPVVAQQFFQQNPLKPQNHIHKSVPIPSYSPQQAQPIYAPQQTPQPVYPQYQNYGNQYQPHYPMNQPQASYAPTQGAYSGYQPQYGSAQFSGYPSSGLPMGGGLQSAYIQGTIAPPFNPLAALGFF